MDDRLTILGCSLPDDEFRSRRAAWSHLESAVVDQAWTHAGFRVRFERTDGVSESLRELAAAEEDCCGWATWAVAEEGGYSVLEVRGPADRISQLAAAFGL